MKTFLKLSLAGLMLATLVPFSRAQDDTVAVPSVLTNEPAVKRSKGAAGERLKGRVDNRDAMLAEKLSLTADQKEQLATLRKRQAEELKSARGDRTKMAALMKSAQQEVRALLTEEQQKKFDKLSPAPMAGGRAGKGKKAGKL